MPAGAARGRSARSDGRCDVGTSWRADYDRDPRPHRAGRPRLRATSTRGSREPGRLPLPHRPRDSRTFPTATGKAQLHRQRRSRCSTCRRARLLLQTVRSHDQYNTTIYGLDDRYRGIKPGAAWCSSTRRTCRARASPTATIVDLVSAWRGRRRAARRRASASSRYRHARGCAAAYFPETNVLVPLDSTAEVSNTPTSKSVVVRLEANRPWPA